MSAMTEALARMLAKRDGLDPDALALPHRHPLNTSAGQVYVCGRYLGPMPAWWLFDHVAQDILAYIESSQFLQDTREADIRAAIRFSVAEEVVSK